MERNICGNNKKSCFEFILKGVFVLLPCIYVFLVCWGFGLDIMKLPPTVNDEIGWYTQAFAVVEYGKPIGYWGYNGTHAAVGTFGAWGAGSIWFLALFVRFLRYILPFPDFGIYIFNNLMWACTANLVLVLCAKPDLKKLLRFTVVYLLLFVNHTYILWGMSETMRYSMGIILAALTIYLWNRQESRFYHVILYGVAPLVIIAFMMSYIMYALVLPLWLIAVYRNSSVLHKHKILSFGAGPVIFLAITVAVYYANGLMVSPYVLNVLSEVRNAFFRGFDHGVAKAMYYIELNLNECTLQTLWNNRNVEFGWPSMYLVIYYVVGLYILISFLAGLTVWKKMDAKDREFYGIGAYMMVGFLTAFILLYNTEAYNLIRGINIALIYALFILCMQSRGTSIKRFSAIMLLAVFPFWLFLSRLVIENHRVQAESMIYQEVFAEHIILDEEKNPWENTVALYGAAGYECMSLPVGVGINTMLSRQPNDHARYVLYMIDTTGMELLDIREQEYIPEIMWQTHELLYRDEKMVLMRNKAPVLPE